MLFKYILLFAVVVICAFGNAKADDLNVEFSGFATLTMSYSDNSDLGFSSNYLNSTEGGFSFSRDSILGGQANIMINNNWDAVVQGIYQDRSVKSFNNFLELAFLRYRPQRNWIIRAGRMNSDIYLLSEYHYVGYAYLWARPPHAYYSFASTAGHYDGVDVEYNNQIDDGFLRVKFALGKTAPELMAGGKEFSITFNDLYMLSVMYLKDEWTLRAATSRSNISNFKSSPFGTVIDGLNAFAPTNIWSQAADFAYGFEAQHHRINYSALGLAYDDYNWLIQAEIGTINSDWLIAPSNINGYLSIGYRFNEVTYFGGISVAKNNKSNAEIKEPELLSYLPEPVKSQTKQLIYLTDYAIKRTTVDQKSVNLGAKWYYSDKLVFKFQTDHFIVQPNGAGLWDIGESTNVGKKHDVNLISFSANLVF